MKRALLFLALGASLAGCASEPVPTSQPRERVRGSLSTWWIQVPAADLSRLAAESQALAKAPRCLGARLRATPDVAHAAWLGSDLAGRALLAQAFSSAGLPAYAESAAAAQRQSQAHALACDRLARARAALRGDAKSAAEEAKAAREALQTLGDGLLAAEAGLLESAAALHGGEAAPALPPLPVPAQQAQAELLRLAFAARSERPAPEGALQRLGALRCGLALDRLADAIRQGALAPAADAYPLARLRAELAGERRNGERALLAAHQARRAAEGEEQQLLARGAPAPERTEVRRRVLEARLLEVQARALAGQSAGAALDAAELAEEARELPDLHTRVESLLGQCLLARRQPEAAAEAYRRAAAAALRAGDRARQARALLNRATALLAGSRDREQITEALAGCNAAVLDGEGQARKQIVTTLFRLLYGELSGREAARRIEGALEQARAAGAWEVELRYAALPGRLRERAREVGVK